MPTVLELSQAELQQYADAIRRRPPATRTPRGAHQEALASAKRAATMLKTRYGATRVLLFGSAVESARFTPDSDLDLAVEGLASRCFWRAWREAEEMLDGRELDLIDIASASTSLRSAIERHGIEL